MESEKLQNIVSYPTGNRIKVFPVAPMELWHRDTPHN